MLLTASNLAYLSSLSQYSDSLEAVLAELWETGVKVSNLRPRILYDVGYRVVIAVANDYSDPSHVAILLGFS